MTRLLIALTLLSVCLVGCSNANQEIKQNDTISIEDFNMFLSRFETDSVFQKERIQFPLVVKRNEVDSEEYKKDRIPVADWRYVNFNQEKYFKLVTEKADSSYVVNVQIEDSGVWVDHIFTRIDGRWFLTFIEDKST